MLTINTIIKELKNVPANRLEDLYSIIQSFLSTTKTTHSSSKKILSYAGSFNEFSEKDYEEFLEHTVQARRETFDRDISL